MYGSSTDYSIVKVLKMLSIFKVKNNGGRRKNFSLLKPKKRGGGNHKSNFLMKILLFSQNTSSEIRQEHQCKLLPTFIRQKSGTLTKKPLTFKAENIGGWAKKLLELKKPPDFSDGLQMDIRFCVTFRGIFCKKCPNALGVGAIALS